MLVLAILLTTVALVRIDGACKDDIPPASKRATGDLVCRRENADNMCATMCLVTKGVKKGYCNEVQKCVCKEKPAVLERKERGQDELACKMPNGDAVCAAFCQLTTGEQKGYCDDEKKCICKEKPAVLGRQERGQDELACKMPNGDAVCAAFCQLTTGEHKGYCDDEKKCVCKEKPAVLERKQRGQDELACKMSNGDAVCAAFCQWTTGEQKGYCDEQKKCVCKEKPAVLGRQERGQDELACKMPNGDAVCAAFCQLTTGEHKGYCDDEKKCICKEKPAVLGRQERGQDELACKMSNGDAVCAAFCHWTTGKEKGYCNDEKKCVCGDKQ